MRCIYRRFGALVCLGLPDQPSKCKFFLWRTKYRWMSTGEIIDERLVRTLLRGKDLQIQNLVKRLISLHPTGPKDKNLPLFENEDTSDISHQLESEGVQAKVIVQEIDLPVNIDCPCSEAVPDSNPKDIHSADLALRDRYNTLASLVSRLAATRKVLGQDRDQIIDRHHHEISTFRTDLAFDETELVRLRKELAASEKKAQEKAEEAENLFELLQALGRDSLNLRTEAAHRQEELTRIGQEFAASEKATGEKAEKELTRLRKELAASERRAAEIKRVASAQGLRKAHKTELEKKDAEISELRSKLSKSENRFMDLERSKDKELEDANQALEGVNAECKELSNNLASKEADLADYEYTTSELEKARASVEELTVKLEAVNVKLEAEKAATSLARSQRYKEESNVMTDREELASLRKKIFENVALGKEVEDLRLALKVEKALVVDIGTKRDELRAQLLEWQESDQIEELRKTIRDMTKENMDLTAELEITEQKRSQYIGLYDKSNATTRSLERDIKRQDKKIKIMEERTESLDEEKESLEQKMKIMKAKAQSLVADLVGY